MKCYVVSHAFEGSYISVFATLEAAKRSHKGKWEGPFSHAKWVTKGTTIVQEFEPHWYSEDDGNLYIYEEELQE